MERGLEDAVLEVGDGRRISGRNMDRLCRTLSNMEEAIKALERRGINLKTHSERMTTDTRRLPIYHVYLGTEEFWFSNRKDLDDFLKKHSEESGRELMVSHDESEDLNTNGKPAGNGKGEMESRLQINEFHEVRTINAGLTSLEEFGFDVESLLTIERTGSQEARYILRRGDSTTALEDLRELPSSIRNAGEKGITVTRFKGLGEMNAEELRDTTLNPENRTLIQVKMTNAADADDMFRILMGDKVEPRREFIEKHALEVRNLDI
jgi:DNA gyrase subunit B